MAAMQSAPRVVADVAQRGRLEVIRNQQPDLPRQVRRGERHHIGRENALRKKGTPLRARNPAPKIVCCIGLAAVVN